MIVEITPSDVHGKIHAPSSKSITQRALAGALLAEGETLIHFPSYCEDGIISMEIAKSLGANIRNITKHVSEKILVKGGFNPVAGTIFCGESGLSLRMFSPIAALSSEKFIFNGEYSLIKRPIDMIEDALTKLGVKCISNGGYLPLEIQGPIKGGEVTVNALVSSQLLTGLLFALPLAKHDSIIYVEELNSRPYVDITMEVIKCFGIVIENIAYKKFIIVGKQKYKPCEIHVEGDWSSASFILCAGALTGEVEIYGLNPYSSQPDRMILEVLQRAGAKVTVTSESIFVEKGKLRCFQFDATHCPDLIPPLVGLAVYCEGESRIKGLKRLKHKESDRGIALKNEFEKLGVKVFLDDDIIRIQSGIISGGVVDSHKDHRIAMSLAVAALKGKTSVSIKESQCVEKSYKSFFKDLKKIGVALSMNRDDV